MSPFLWCPGAIHVVGGSGGTMVGGPARATWHSYERGYALTAVRGMQALINAGNDLHLCFNPITGQLAQGLPATASGKGLANVSGGVETNRMGSVNIQVEVVARASRPFTLDITPAGLATLHRIVEWMRTWGIPTVWPAGPPVAYANSYPASHYVRPVTTWKTKAGHYAHSQVPENEHGDPGAIDITKMFATEPAAPVEPTRKEYSDMVVVRTPSNGDFLLTSLGRVSLTKADADAAEAGGFPVADLGATTLTNLTAANATLVARLDDLSRQIDALTIAPVDVNALATALAALDKSATVTDIKAVLNSARINVI